jgi:hypothetical protein
VEERPSEFSNILTKGNNEASEMTRAKNPRTYIDAEGRRLKTDLGRRLDRAYRRRRRRTRPDTVTRDNVLRRIRHARAGHRRGATLDDIIATAAELGIPLVVPTEQAGAA